MLSEKCKGCGKSSGSCSASKAGRTQSLLPDQRPTLTAFAPRGWKIVGSRCRRPVKIASRGDPLIGLVSSSGASGDGWMRRPNLYTHPYSRRFY